jgi:hypothetical protein
LAPNATKLNDQASIKLLKTPHQAKQSSLLHLKQQSIQANASRLIGLIVDTYSDGNMQEVLLSALCRFIFFCTIVNSVVIMPQTKQ